LKGRLWTVACVLGAAVIVTGLASVSLAQRVRPGEPLSVIVGAPLGPTVMDRLDARRSNRSASPLPTQSLRIIWSRKLHRMTHTPLVLEDGSIVAIAEDGETLFLNADGTDKAHLAFGPGPMSAPALLSDGTVVAVNGAGDAVGAQHAAVRWRTHVADPPASAEESSRRRGRVFMHHGRRVSQPESEETWTAGSPLSLDDGGVVVSIDRHLVCLDSRGTVRAQATAPESIGYPLVATSHAVAMITDSGEVFEWTPGDEAVQRRGSFGAAIESVAALEPPRDLLAVMGNHIMALNVTTGELSQRSASDRGVYVGPPTLLPDGLLVQEMTPTGTRAVHLEHAAPLQVIAMLTPQGAQAMGDGGALVFLAPTHTALLADPAGAVAYGTVDGRIGVASTTEKTELGEYVCGHPAPPSADPYRGGRPSAGFVGIVPAGPKAFVVSCEDGNVSLIRGD
jgi:outer membrane protein assembly factor BamB